MPGRFDQQPTHMGIAGLGDRPLHAGVARGVLTGHQADVSADRGPGEPGPVTDLDRQRQTGQCRDAAQTAQPVDRVGEPPRGGHHQDLFIEAIRAAVAASTASKL